MPTIPIKSIVARDLEDDVKKLLKSWTIYLDEVVNFGSELLKKIGDSEELGGGEEAPLILTLRNSLELLDAISILITKSSIDPCKPLLRVILESLFTVCYITEKDSVERANNYLVCHYQKKLSFYKKLDPNSQQGKQWIKDIKSDRLAGEMVLKEFQDLPRYINNVEKTLKKQKYKRAVAEYNRIKKKGTPAWHAFYNGPKSKYDLAKHLQLLGIYNLLYRQFSEDAHGMNIIDKKIGKSLEGFAEIVQIRAPLDAQLICSLSISIIIDMYRILINHYIPSFGSEFATWYMREIKTFANKLSTDDLLTVK